jgi:DNA mismatch endonuclease (patch repair protein)
MGKRIKAVRKRLGGLRNFEGVDAKRSHTMSLIRGRGNRSTEKKVRAALVQAGVRGWKMHPTAIEGRPDFYFPLSKIVLFVDGCFWHGCKTCYRRPNSRQFYWDWKLARNKKRDRQVDRLLDSQGYRVVRFWEHEVLRDLARVVASIKREIDRRGVTSRGPKLETSPPASTRNHAAKQRQSRRRGDSTR